MTEQTAEQTPPPEKPAETPPEFTPPTSQEELDRIIGQRLARERQRFADYDDLKDKATKYDEALEAQKTEAERAIEAARTEGRTEALSTANARLKLAEARALAAEAKFRNPTLAVRAIDLDAVNVSDDGTVDTDAIKDALKSLADADPYLVDDGKPPAPKVDRGQGAPRGTERSSVGRGREMYQEKHAKTS